jgi:hypothetical protein
MPFNRKLWCTPVGHSYLYERHEGLFFHEEHEVADMAACIAFFKQFDPLVKVINTFAGSHAETIYVRTDDGWQAFDPPKQGGPATLKTPMVRH